MQAVLEHIYGARCTIRKENIVKLLRAANAYKLLALKLQCEQHLARTLMTENAVEMALLGERTSAYTLRLAAVTFIGQNYGKIKVSTSFAAREIA